jgi:dTDP-4-dehydrorhamnose 3,5-epimerase
MAAIESNAGFALFVCDARRIGREHCMQIRPTEIAEVLGIQPVRHPDLRGFFSEIYREPILRQHGIDAAFVQENHSLSVERAVLRGLHFQIPPVAQGKLVRLAAGAILDVAVDIRVGSPTWSCHVAVILSAAEGNQLFIPEGFAHGFYTLEPNTEVVYEVTSYYSPEHERGLSWDDPEPGVAWPPSSGEPMMLNRDRPHPMLRQLPRYFTY